jgi:hypothetical protein
MCAPGKKEVFFFEKKNQKTFTNGVRGAIQNGPRASIDKSFLLPFSKKEGLPYCMSFLLR